MIDPFVFDIPVSASEKKQDPRYRLICQLYQRALHAYSYDWHVCFVYLEELRQQAAASTYFKDAYPPFLDLLLREEIY